MKNIVLAILAILFIVIILFHFMDVQLEHYTSSSSNSLNPEECKAMDTNDAISKLFYKIRISTQELNAIQNIINAQNTYSDDSIIQSLINLNISDSNLNGILTNHASYPTSKTKVKVFRCALQSIIKSEFDDGLIIHFPLDSISSDGKTIINEAIGQKLVPQDQAYTGTLMSAGNGSKPTLDSNDVRGRGLNSMKFNGTDSNNGGYISINKLPTFWDKSNQNFLGFSLAVWVKASKYPSNAHWSRIIDFAAGEKYNNNICITVTNTHNNNKGDLAFIVANGSWDKPEASYGLTYSPGGEEILDDKWRHYVFTVTPSNSGGTINYKIYINGVLTNSNYYNAVLSQDGITAWSLSGPDATISNPPNNLIRTFNFIGKSNYPWDNYFNGWMADFRIYEKELSADTIGRLYNYVNPSLPISSTRQLFSSSALASANGSIPQMPGGPVGPEPKVNIGLFADKNVITTSNGVITWSDTSGFGNHAIASSSEVKYCNITNKVTVPSGSYMDIALNPKCNYGAPFTLFIVADVKSFNPQTIKGSGNMRCNHLFASPDFDGFELAFTDNLFVSCVQGRSCMVQPLNMFGIDGNGRNIYTVRCDEKGRLSVWINSTPVITQQPFVNGYIPQNKKIRLACAFGKDQYPSSDNIDYFQIQQLSGLLTDDYIQFSEAWMATAWGIKSKMNQNNPYLSYRFE